MRTQKASTMLKHTPSAPRILLPTSGIAPKIASLGCVLALTLASDVVVGQPLPPNSTCIFAQDTFRLSSSVPGGTMTLDVSTRARGEAPEHMTMMLDVAGVPFLHVEAMRFANFHGDVRAHFGFGSAFQGVHEETFASDGTEASGVIDGRRFLEIDGATTFLDGQPPPAFAIDPGAVKTAQTLFAITNGGFGSCSGTSTACSQCEGRCAVSFAQCGAQQPTNCTPENPSLCLPDPAGCSSLYKTCVRTCSGGCDTCCLGASRCDTGTHSCEVPPRPPPPPPPPQVGPPHEVFAGDWDAEVRVEATPPVLTPDGLLYMSANKFYYMSDDGGATWTIVNWMDYTSASCPVPAPTGGDTDVVAAKFLGFPGGGANGIQPVYAEFLKNGLVAPVGMRLIKTADLGGIDPPFVQCRDLDLPEGTAFMDKASLAVVDFNEDALYAAWQDGGGILNGGTQTSRIWLQKVPLDSITGKMLSPLPATPIKNPGPDAPAMHWGNCEPTDAPDNAGRGNLTSDASGGVYVAFTSNTGKTTSSLITTRRIYVEKIVGANPFISCVDQYSSGDFASQGHLDLGDPEMVVDDFTGQMVVVYSKAVLGGLRRIMLANSVADAPNWTVQEVFSGGRSQDQSQPALALNKSVDAASRRTGDVYTTWYEPAALNGVARAARGFIFERGANVFTPVSTAFLMENGSFIPFPFPFSQENRGVHEFQGVTHFPGRANGAGGWFAGWTRADPNFPSQANYHIVTNDWF